MSHFEDLSFSLEQFSGQARLFPLPNLVLFPQVLQPLHIFEPRYRDLLEDALGGDRLVAMTVLRPGWESDYEGRPALYPFGCLGRVTTCNRMSDGTYNLLLLGLRRVRLVDELDTPRRYRVARVEVCEDFHPPNEAAARAVLQRRLREAFLHWLPSAAGADQQIDQLLESDVSLGVLTDLAGYMLEIGIARKAELLAELNVHRRAEILLEHLAAAARGELAKTGPEAFPPPFSSN